MRRPQRRARGLRASSESPCAGAARSRACTCASPRNAAWPAPAAALSRLAATHRPARAAAPCRRLFLRRCRSSVLTTNATHPSPSSSPFPPSGVRPEPLASQQALAEAASQVRDSSLWPRPMQVESARSEPLLSLAASPDPALFFPGPSTSRCSALLAHTNRIPHNTIPGGGGGGGGGLQGSMLHRAGGSIMKVGGSGRPRNRCMGCWSALL